MKAISISQTIKTPKPLRSKHFDEMTEFYDHATADYQFWSKDMNMHYGFMKDLSQFFNREKMLEQMNQEVFSRLKLNGKSMVIDAGCGTGASARSFVKYNPEVKVVGVNLVHSHIVLGKALNRKSSQSNRIQLLHADYHQMPLPNNIANGVYAMESMCHSPNKQLVINEIHRVLAPGGKLVIADCFVINPNKAMGRLGSWAYNSFRKCWSVPHLAEINLFKTMLADAGFENIIAEDVSHRVAPSVMHSPFVVVKFLWNQLVNGKSNGTQTIKNLKAVLLSIIMGLKRNKFRYFLVAAQKK